MCNKDLRYRNHSPKVNHMEATYTFNIEEVCMLAIALQDQLSNMEAAYVDLNPLNTLRHNTVEAAEAYLAMLERIHPSAAAAWCAHLNGRPREAFPRKLAEARYVAEVLAP